MAQLMDGEQRKRERITKMNTAKGLIGMFTKESRKSGSEKSSPARLSRAESGASRKSRASRGSQPEKRKSKRTEEADAKEREAAAIK